MQISALIGLMKSRAAYVRDWGDAAEAQEGGWAPERIFDMSSILNEKHEQDEVVIHHDAVGRNFPFPLFSVVGAGPGVMVFSGDEEGFYVYCYTSPVSMLLTRFTPQGVICDGFNRRDMG